MYLGRLRPIRVRDRRKFPRPCTCCNSRPFRIRMRTVLRAPIGTPFPNASYTPFPLRRRIRTRPGICISVILYTPWPSDICSGICSRSRTKERREAKGALQCCNCGAASTLLHTALLQLPRSGFRTRIMIHDGLLVHSFSRKHKPAASRCPPASPQARLRPISVRRAPPRPSRPRMA